MSCDCIAKLMALLHVFRVSCDFSPGSKTRWDLEISKHRVHLHFTFTHLSTKYGLYKHLPLLTTKAQRRLSEGSNRSEVNIFRIRELSPSPHPASSPGVALRESLELSPSSKQPRRAIIPSTKYTQQPNAAIICHSIPAEMDIAYDHIQEESLSPTSEKPHTSPQPPTDGSNASTSPEAAPAPTSPTVTADLQSALQAAASSPWGSTLNSWFTTARQQGQSFYADLQKEAEQATEQATKGFSSLREEVVKRTRSLSLGGGQAAEGLVPGEESVPVAKDAGEVERVVSHDSTGAGAAAEAEALQQSGAVGDKPESLPADIVKEAGTLVASLRSTAASKLKDLQRAEDAADEALLKFGTNIRNFLRDAVVISAPDEEQRKEGEGEVLFETQEPGTGRKVFHSTRLEAQLHAIHSTATSFTQEPAEGGEWEVWREGFDVEERTEGIAGDLEKYEELRRAMEKLVPELVEYRVFWMRYYFLRKAVEEEERRRREVLKGNNFHPIPISWPLILMNWFLGAAADTSEEVAWDDEDDDNEASSTPNASNASNAVKSSHAASASTTTLTQGGLKASEPRRSHEDEAKSVADSDASYDIVSGATSRAMGSPKEEKRSGRDESDDDDWE